LNTGSFRGDLEIWFEQLVEDISSGPGHALFRERINDVRAAQAAAGYVYQNLVCLIDRCAGRLMPALSEIGLAVEELHE
jgi:hypothetical protein